MKDENPSSSGIVLGRWLVGAVLLAALAIGVYGRSLENAFTRDDGIHFEDEARWTRPVSKVLENFSEPWWAEEQGGLYRPLTAASIQVTSALFGLKPPPLRVENVVLHSLVALAVCALAARLRLSRPAIVALGALAFAHPLTSEAVLEIVSRSETMAAGFSLAAVLAVTSRRPLVRVTCGPLWLIALSSKESALGALPAILVAGFFGLRQRSMSSTSSASGDGSAAIDPPAVESSGPASLKGQVSGSSSSRSLSAMASSCGLALAVYLSLRMTALGSFVGLEPDSISPLDNPLVAVGTAQRLMTAIAVVPRYVLLFLWPSRLSPDYSMAAIDVVKGPADSWFGAGLVVIMAVAIWFVRAWRRRAHAEVIGLLLAAGMYLPASNLLMPVGTIMAERLFYAPCLGLLLAITGLIERCFISSGQVHMARTEHRRQVTEVPAHPGRRALVSTLLLGLALLLAVRTHLRALDWKDNDTLFDRALAVVPESARVQCNVGFARLKKELHADAVPFYERAIAIFPAYVKAHSQIAICLVKLRNDEKALEHWRIAASDQHSSADDLVNYSSSVVKLAPSRRNLTIAREVLEQWLKDHGPDPKVERELDQILSMLRG